jgi:uncharacterized damage-inducible protein DinB
MSDVHTPPTTTLDLLRAEFAREATTARRLIERLPDDTHHWRPHAKSFTAGRLACHIVDCLGWADAILAADEFAIDPASYRPFEAETTGAVLAGFDSGVETCTTRLASVSEDVLLQPWRLVKMGKVRFVKPRLAVFRDFTLNHLIHHRGQLSVYLRLLDLPVPAVYGPTADEPF